MDSYKVHLSCTVGRENVSTLTISCGFYLNYAVVVITSIMQLWFLPQLCSCGSLVHSYPVPRSFCEHHNNSNIQISLSQ